MLFMPHNLSGKEQKIGLPYHGPYRIGASSGSTGGFDYPCEHGPSNCLSGGAIPNESWLGRRARK